MIVDKFHVWVGSFRDSDPAYLSEPDSGRLLLPSQFMSDIGVIWSDNPKNKRYGPPHKGGRFWSPNMLSPRLHVREVTTETAFYEKSIRGGGRSARHLEWGRIQRYLRFVDAPKSINTVVVVAYSPLRPKRARAGLKYLGAFPVRK